MSASSRGSVLEELMGEHTRSYCLGLEGNRSSRKNHPPVTPEALEEERNIDCWGREGGNEFSLGVWPLRSSPSPCSSGGLSPPPCQAHIGSTN